MYLTKLSLLICIFIIGLIIFLRGFLPMKNSISGHSSFDDLPTEFPAGDHGNCSVKTCINTIKKYDRNSYKASFRRVVFILIDALRADFIPSLAASVLQAQLFDKDVMLYTESLIKEGFAIPFISRAFSPTVTLPRIKSLVSGTVPSFVDVLMNLDAASFQEDSFIYQAHKEHKKIIFYGDDTWLRLFPNSFARKEGTTSFFVTDYTEVDRNVSRHLEEELRLLDWDVLILHYLGVDHIGHLAGPSSSLLPVKLREMDEVIKVIHQWLVEISHQSLLPDLIVLSGDHGMTQSGSHGGVSEAELLTPLIFITTKSWKNKAMHKSISHVSQIDLAPTLAVLMGVPIPQNNAGCVISKLLEASNLTSEEQLYALFYNVHQMLKVLHLNAHTVSSQLNLLLQKATYWHSTFLNKLIQNSNKAFHEENAYIKAKESYNVVLSELSNLLTTLTSEFDVYALFTGITITFQITVYVIFFYTYFSSQLSLSVFREMTVNSILVAAVITVAHLTLCIFAGSSLCSSNVKLFVLFTVIFTCSLLLMSSFNEINAIGIIRSVPQLCTVKSILLCNMVLHIISLSSTSFIEEEHQTWYFFATTFLLLIFIRKLKHVFEMKYKQNIAQFTEKQIKNISCYSNTESEETCEKHNAYKVKECQSTCSCSASSLKTETCYNSEFFFFAILLFTSRVLRSWNQTGDKWVHLPDVGDWLVQAENKSVLSILVVFATCLIIYIIFNSVCHLQQLVMISGMIWIYMYRVRDGTLLFPCASMINIDRLTIARIVYFHIAAILVYGVIKFLRSVRVNCYFLQPIKNFSFLVIHCWLLLTLLLSRPHNIPVLAGIVLQEKLLSKLVFEVPEETITRVQAYHLMAMSSFFYQGNSNKLSSLDVSAGYVGIASYQPLLVGIQMVCNTYSGTLFWFLMLLYRINQNYLNKCTYCIKTKYFCDVVSICTFLLLCRYLTTFVYLLLLSFQRYHLFVWSVLAPKLLYESAHTAVFSLFVIFGLMACSIGCCLYPDNCKQSRSELE